MSNIFGYYSPTKVVFGKDAHLQVAQLIKEQGCKKVLLHYGSQSAKKTGLLDTIENCLREGGVDYVELGGVVPNPRLGKVYEGIELCRKEGVDFILAVGGGSTIDSAKAIAYGLANEGDVWDLYRHVKHATACLPVASVLTIAAAGSETSNGSVITNEKTGEKRAYDSDLSRPKFAIMNPELTMTLPDYQTQSGCVDILMHTMERWFSGAPCMEITDRVAAAVLKTVMENAKILYKDPKNYAARAEVMWSGSISHNGLTGFGNDGGDWTCHNMEHELGGMFDVAHGAGLAAVWGSWARYVCKYNLPRFVKYALHVMGVEPGATDEETALRGIEAQEDFYRSIGMPTNLKELGVAPTEEQMHVMAKGCAEAGGGQQGSIKVLYEEDLFEIYKLANKENEA
ncbi:MAG: iron-containing alcohol dehydrogenase [Oscillospiraceae bacterium]|nr:iron-containing alcohol dehydrogenase [Oscillospiraceae bacterium]